MNSIKHIFKKPKEKLVLTLLVRNEADIILDNIFYHYSRGVDFIIVADNGSDDGTLEILEKLQEDGLIHLLREKLYNQDRIVNKMGKIAQEKYGATMLIHADADEFWTPTKVKKLKPAFIKLNRPAALVARNDALPVPEHRYDSFPQRSMNIVTKHIMSDDVKNDSKKISLFLFWLPPKVMFSIKDNFKIVGFGNHSLWESDSGEVTKDIVIYHFPFKSAERFTEKVVIGGRAMEEIEQDDEICWHWRRWYKQYNKGTLNKEIDILIPDFSEIKGVEYEKFDYNDRILKEIKNNNKLWKMYERHVANRLKIIAKVNTRGVK